MSEKTEITFMQTRLIRLASEEWHLPVEQIIHLFKEADVLGYIAVSYTHLDVYKRQVLRSEVPKDRKGTDEPGRDCGHGWQQVYHAA